MLKQDKKEYVFNDSMKEENPDPFNDRMLYERDNKCFVG